MKELHGPREAEVEALCGDLSAIRAPRGPELNARSWQTEAPLRMLLNNLDREVAEKPERNLLFLRATIVVDRPTHKGIVIGTDGRRLREIGRRARLGLERLFGLRVFLELFVRVETGWARNPRRLRELGL